MPKVKTVKSTATKSIRNSKLNRPAPLDLRTKATIDRERALVKWLYNTVPLDQEVSISAADMMAQGEISRRSVGNVRKILYKNGLFKQVIHKPVITLPNGKRIIAFKQAPVHRIVLSGSYEQAMKVLEPVWNETLEHTQENKMRANVMIGAQKRAKRAATTEIVTNGSEDQYMTPIISGAGLPASDTVAVVGQDPQHSPFDQLKNFDKQAELLVQQAREYATGYSTVNQTLDNLRAAGLQVNEQAFFESLGWSTSDDRLPIIASILPFIDSLEDRIRKISDECNTLRMQNQQALNLQKTVTQHEAHIKRLVAENHDLRTRLGQTSHVRSNGGPKISDAIEAATK